MAEQQADTVKQLKQSGGASGERNPYTITSPDAHQLNPKWSIIFSLKEGVGTLSDCLQIFKERNINMTRIESRKSLNPAFDYDFFVDVDVGPDSEEKMVALNKELVEKKGNILSMVTNKLGTIWFPRKMKDLDGFSVKSLEYGEVLEADHPGFKDDTYRRRRKEITEKAKNYRYGSPLPDVEYIPSEIETWGTVYTRLRSLFSTHACDKFNKAFPLLEAQCGYGPNKIPQIREVSEFLHDQTGWRLRPVTGLLSARDFLNALAFRVFHSTQYIRHESMPLYTPEPDVCHELIGHVPLLADPDFADFSQEIGLASLGASDEDISKLATVYWFTVEFGICKEKGELKAYGAGLPSSYGELTYCLTNEPKFLSFEPDVTSTTKYPITSYQPVYFVTESFQEATAKVREYAQKLNRPFTVRYNPLTENIEVLDKKESLVRFAKAIQSDFKLLSQALERIQSISY